MHLPSFLCLSLQKLSYLLTAAAVTFKNGDDGGQCFYFINTFIFIFIFRGTSSAGQNILSGTHIVMHVMKHSLLLQNRE